MTSPTRVLIDWDWGSSGIWSIGNGGTCCILRTGNSFAGISLSAQLLHDLREWNDEAGRVNRLAPSQPTDDLMSACWSEAPGLAQRVRDEVGDEAEVLYNERGRAWTWTRRPARWD
jgi:hypothetical protein